MIVAGLNDKYGVTQSDASSGGFPNGLVTVQAFGFGIGIGESAKAAQSSSNPNSPDRTPSQEDPRPILSSLAVRFAKLTGEFKKVVDLEHGSLSLRLGNDSALEWSLTYRNVEPGKMQEKVQALAAELNAKLAQMVAALPYSDRMTRGWKVSLAERCSLPEVTEKQHVRVACTTLIDNSLNRHRLRTQQVNSESRISHSEFLKDRDQTWIDNHSQRLAIAFFRFFAGFPASYDHIGTVWDPGDLAEGKVIRTDIEGASSGTATSFPNGVRGYRCLDHAHDIRVGVVGRLF
jgi:hypothetical protein